MSIRNINVIKKPSSANTQYWDFEDPLDEAFVYKWLNILLAEMTEFCQSDTKLRDSWFDPIGTLPKACVAGQFKPNSYASVLGGIVAAKHRDLKKNLSSPQLRAVEMLFAQINTLYPTDVPNTIKFACHEAKPKLNIKGVSTFNELFSN